MILVITNACAGRAAAEAESEERDVCVRARVLYARGAAVGGDAAGRMAGAAPGAAKLLRARPIGTAGATPPGPCTVAV